MTDIISTDALAEAHYAAHDPQFQEEKELTDDEMLDKLSAVYEMLDDAQMILYRMNYPKPNKKITEAENNIKLAMSALEEEM